MCAESCHESAALRFVTEYGVADAIGDESKSLLDICSEVQVNFRYMGPYSDMGASEYSV